MDFHELSQIMLKEYVSDARQLQVKDTLENLRLQSLMRSHDIKEVSSGLTRLVDTINELSPQCPKDFRSDSHKIDYLRRAISEPFFRDWASIPIQNITSQRYSFNMFVITLHESIQNLKQMQLLSREISRPKLTGVVHLPDTSDTHMTSYGRNPRHVGQHGSFTRRSPTKSMLFEDARRRKECFKCGALNWKPVHKCDPGTIAAHTRDRLRRGDSSVHIVSDITKGLKSEIGDVRHSAQDTYHEHNAELSEFESLFESENEQPGRESTFAVHPLAEADQNVFTKHLSSMFHSIDSNNEDFSQGDVED